MTDQNNVLSPADRKQCERIAARSDMHGQRAKALLALDDGASQAQAAEQASLSTGQVRYALGRYKKLGLGIFPEDVLPQAVSDLSMNAAAAKAAASAVEEAEIAEPAPESSPKKEKKKKSKKEKEKKASKKGKKKSGKGKKKKKKKKKK